MNSLVAIVGLSLALTLGACSSDEGGDRSAAPKGANGGGSSGLEYGTDAYYKARIKLYEDSGAVPGGKVLTVEHLPWDPNGPTIKLSDLAARLNQAALYDTSEEYAGARGEMEKLTNQVEFACSGDLSDWEAAAQVDEILTILRLGNGLGGGGIDASGGVDCGNGNVIGGTGRPIFSSDDEEAFALTGNSYKRGTIAAPLVP